MSGSLVFMRTVSLCWHFGVILTLIYLSLFKPEADPILLSVTYDLLIFLLLFLICPSLPLSYPCKLDSLPPNGIGS